MTCEIKVMLKGSNKSLTMKKMVTTKTVECKFDDPEIEHLIKETQEKFGEDSSLAKIKVTVNITEV